MQLSITFRVINMKKYILIIPLIILSITTGCSSNAKNMASAACCGTEVVAYAAEPSILPVDISLAGEKLAEYTTGFDTPKSARGKNIKRAAEAINNKVLQPGEVFSFNDTVGPTNKKNGFHLARIFVNGKDSKGYGGGVCQVSSTLFNAIEKLGLQITERHNHSKEVFYVPKGKDAATSHGTIDFKFKNTLQFPIKINSFTKENKVTVEVLKA